MPSEASIRWSHVGLNCQDPAATEAFYQRWFGFQRARVIVDGDTRVTFLRHGDVYLELFAVTGERPTATNDGPQLAGTVRHLAFQVDDVDAFLARADGELTVTLGPLDFGEVIPGWRTVWITDPDGVVVEISQGYRDQDPAELAAFGGSRQPGQLRRQLQGQSQGSGEGA